MIFKHTATALVVHVALMNVLLNNKVFLSKLLKKHFQKCLESRKFLYNFFTSKLFNIPTLKLY